MNLKRIFVASALAAAIIAIASLARILMTGRPQTGSAGELFGAGLALALYFVITMGGVF